MGQPTGFTRWVVLYSACLVNIMAGTQFAFGFYQGALRSAADLSDADIELLNLFLTLGLASPLAGGFVFDHYGALPTSIGSVLLNCIGYFLLYGVSLGWSFVPNGVAFVCFYIFLAGHAVAWLLEIPVKYVATSFPLEMGGKTIGGSMSFFGITSGVLSLIFINFLDGSASGLFMLLIINGGVAPVLAYFLCRPAPPMTMNTKETGIENVGAWEFKVLPFRLRIMMGLSISMTLYVSAASLLADHGGGVWWTLGLLAGICIIPCLMFGLPFRYTVTNEKADWLKTDFHGQLPHEGGEEGPGGMTVMEAVKSWDLWLLAIVFNGTNGVGSVLAANAFQLCASRVALPDSYVVGDPNATALPLEEQGGKLALRALALFSVWNAAATLGFGFLSDHFYRTTSRAFFAFASNVLMAAGCVISAFCPPGVLLFSIALCGWAMGGIFAVLAAILIELFGPANFGMLWGITCFTPNIGIFLLGYVLTGGNLDSLKEEGHYALLYPSGSTKGSRYCVGEKCFQVPLMVLAATSALGAVAGFVLHVRMSKKALPNEVEMSKSTDDARLLSACSDDDY